MIEAYKQLLRVFESRERPDHFTDYTHCEECAKHDATLQRRNNDTISFSDVGNISNTPIFFITVEGFLYFLPGLARLASSAEDDNEYFLDTFLTHLDNESRRSAMTKHERIALAKYLNKLKQEIGESIKLNLDEEDLDELIIWLSREKKGHP